MLAAARGPGSGTQGLQGGRRWCWQWERSSGPQVEERPYSTAEELEKESTRKRKKAHLMAAFIIPSAPSFSVSLRAGRGGGALGSGTWGAGAGESQPEPLPRRGCRQLCGARRRLTRHLQAPAPPPGQPCPAPWRPAPPELQHGVLLGAGGVVGGNVNHPPLPTEEVAAHPARRRPGGERRTGMEGRRDECRGMDGVSE